MTANNKSRVKEVSNNHDDENSLESTQINVDVNMTETDNNMSDSEPPRPPSLHIDLLLQSINRSKVSEASNVSDFMDVVESDQDSPPIRQIISEDPNYKPQCLSLGSINGLSTSDNANFQNLSENKSDTFPEPTVEGGSFMGGNITANESTTQDGTFNEKPTGIDETNADQTSQPNAILNEDHAPKIVDVAPVQVAENTEESSTDVSC